MDDDTEIGLIEVSIHAPREGCDGVSLLPKWGTGTFQFTHPGRGATIRVRMKTARI